MTIDSGLSNSQRELLPHCGYSGLAPENSAQDLQMHSETRVWAGPFLGVVVQVVQYSTKASNAEGRQSLAAWQWEQLILFSVFTRKRNDLI